MNKQSKDNKVDEVVRLRVRNIWKIIFLPIWVLATLMVWLLFDVTLKQAWEGKL